MTEWLRSLALCFAAGAVGGLVKSLVIWASARYGIHPQFGVSFAAALTPAVLYPRVVLGGLWGMLFVLPLARNSVWLRGLWLGLLVTVVQLVVVPLLAHRGLHLLTAAAAFTLLFNLVWGLATALMLRLLRAG